MSTSFNVYYYNKDNQGGDVTNKFINIVNTSKKTFFNADNKTFGDMSPGKRKYFYISFNGGKLKKLGNEGDKIYFSSKDISSAIKIINAQKQNKAAQSSIDTTTQNATTYTDAQAKADADAQAKADADAQAAAKAKADADAAAAAAAKAAAEEAAALNAFAGAVSKNQLKMAKYDNALNTQESAEMALASVIPAKSNLQVLDGSQYTTQQDITSKTNNVVRSYAGKFEFVQFSNDSIKSYKNSCVAPDEYASANAYNMTLLDSNNLHTAESCKKNAALQNKSYYSLVKPAGSQPGSNLYKCYGSNDAPSRNEHDYVTVWPLPTDTFGTNVSSLNIDSNGDLYVNYSNGQTPYYLTNNGKKFDNTMCTSGTNSCKFYMTLKDSGNIEVHRVFQSTGSNANKRDEIIWQLLSNINVRSAIATLLPLAKQAWSVPNNDTLTAGESIQNISSSAAPPSNGITSPTGFFKLEVVDGKLQLKASIFACSSENTTYTPASVTDNSVKMYTNENAARQSYYPYQLNQTDPKINQPYYTISANGYNVLMPIDKSNPSLTIGNTYTEYDGYIPSGSETNFITTSNANECKNACSSDPTCTQVYVKGNTVSSSRGVDCTLSSSTTVYIPNQTNPLNKDSTLYIRNYKMNLDKMQNKNNIPTDFAIKTDTLSYSSYTIGNTISSGSFSYGDESTPAYMSMMDQHKKLQWGTGTAEGFNDYGYYNPSAECNATSGAGCQPLIQNKQITPLIQISNDYTNQINQMTQNYVDISNNISTYNSQYKIVNSDNKYDFSANQQFTLEDNTIQTAMLQDTKQMALQQNNLTIAGTILTTTLLITAIYLGM